MSKDGPYSEIFSKTLGGIKSTVLERRVFVFTVSLHVYHIGYSKVNNLCHKVLKVLRIQYLIQTRLKQAHYGNIYVV